MLDKKIVNCKNLLYVLCMAAQENCINMINHFQPSNDLKCPGGL